MEAGKQRKLNRLLKRVTFNTRLGFQRTEGYQVAREQYRKAHKGRD